VTASPRSASAPAPRALLHAWLAGPRNPAPSTALLRGLYYAIVDEADSVLIDEARTPLIIASDVEDPHGRSVYEQALALAGCLDRSRHYVVHAQERSIELTDAGRAAVAEFARGLSGLWGDCARARGSRRTGLVGAAPVPARSALHSGRRQGADRR
jgi:hypothetical protein